MRRWRFSIWLVALIGLSSVGIVWQRENKSVSQLSVHGSSATPFETLKVFGVPNLTTSQEKWRYTPSHLLIIQNPEGKKLTLDFEGDTVKISGELQLNEASKMFFEGITPYLQQYILSQCEKKEGKQ